MSATLGGDPYGGGTNSLRNILAVHEVVDMEAVLVQDDRQVHRHPVLRLCMKIVYKDNKSEAHDEIGVPHILQICRESVAPNPITSSHGHRRRGVE